MNEHKENESLFLTHFPVGFADFVNAICDMFQQQRL